MTSFLNNNSKCTKCDKYYGHSLFENKCSGCFAINNPDIWNIVKNEENEIVRINNLRYSKNYLDEFTKNRSLPNNNFLWTSLKQMYKDGSITKENNIINWLNFLKKNTIYQGISSKQAIELTNIYNNSPKQYVHKDNKWKIQHSVCGLVIDWWNLNANLVGGISCYYIYAYRKPFLNKKIKPAAAFDTKCNTGLYKFWYNNIIKSD
jgi:hypothetical protein